jgi:heme/copper-type cytochrome/quinol oxidase subunit 2
MKKNLKKLGQWVKKSSIAFYILLLTSTTAYAGEVGDSKLATGTQDLINDLTIWLMILAPIIGVLVIIYFFIRRAASDEMDQKKWNNRITTAIISVIGAVLTAATLNLVIGYYS